MKTDVRTVELCMHDLPYEGERQDGNTPSRRLQLSSQICILERNLSTCRTLRSSGRVAEETRQM
jgi:hypothetical protein